jgi:hypothetical protein
MTTIHGKTVVNMRKYDDTIGFKLVTERKYTFSVSSLCTYTSNQKSLVLFSALRATGNHFKAWCCLSKAGSH